MCFRKIKRLDLAEKLENDIGVSREENIGPGDGTSLTLCDDTNKLSLLF